jgi:hypothetical protein
VKRLGGGAARSTTRPGASGTSARTPLLINWYLWVFSLRSPVRRMAVFLSPQEYEQSLWPDNSYHPVCRTPHPPVLVCSACPESYGGRDGLPPQPRTDSKLLIFPSRSRRPRRRHRHRNRQRSRDPAQRRLPTTVIAGTTERREPLRTACNQGGPRGLLCAPTGHSARRPGRAVAGGPSRKRARPVARAARQGRLEDVQEVRKFSPARWPKIVRPRLMPCSRGKEPIWQGRVPLLGHSRSLLIHPVRRRPCHLRRKPRPHVHCRNWHGRRFPPCRQRGPGAPVARRNPGLAPPCWCED